MGRGDSLGTDAEPTLGDGVLVFREQPEADGNLRAVEEQAGEGDFIEQTSELGVRHSKV